MHKLNISRKSILIFFALLAIGIAGALIFNLSPEKISSRIMNQSGVIPTLVPGSFPFEELTIPYLRSREYNSSLGELEKYSENSKTVLYLTSYLSDGLKVNGLLLVPKGEMPRGGWPAIVFVHGYIAPSIYKTTERYNDYVNSLAEAGFVVFKIDLRGHGDSEGEAGGAYYSGDYVIDTLNAYAALQNTSLVNHNKIGLWGHSMAGNITFRSFVVKKNIPAVVVWAGAGFTYEDLVKYRIMDTSYRAPQQSTERAKRRQEMRDLYGEFDFSNSFWQKVTPVNYLEEIGGAISLHHAEDDQVVSIEYSRNLTTILNQADIVHQLVEYPSGGHNLTGVIFEQAMNDTIEFYNKFLR